MLILISFFLDNKKLSTIDLQAAVRGENLEYSTDLTNEYSAQYKELEEYFCNEVRVCIA